MIKMFVCCTKAKYKFWTETKKPIKLAFRNIYPLIHIASKTGKGLKKNSYKDTKKRSTAFTDFSVDTFSRKLLNGIPNFSLDH